MKQRLKQLYFRLRGKDPEPVIASFASGPRALVDRMVDEVHALLPGYRHTLIETPQQAAQLARCNIAMAPVLLSRDPEFRALRELAFRMARNKVLAYNEQLERLHLTWRDPISSYLFWRGVPLDRVRLRPSWLVPWKRDRTRPITSHQVHAGKPASGKPRIAIFTPYSPYPLSHGGAVRMYNLLCRLHQEFDFTLLTFSDTLGAADLAALQAICSEVIVFPQPYFREPHWSTWRPPEVCEFDDPYVRNVVNEAQVRTNLLQVEYTQLAAYPGDILVEHDVTFDLFEQIARKQPTLISRWNAWRWKRFEPSAVGYFRAVVSMSTKDQQLIGASHVIPNGVDLERFEPLPPSRVAEILFVGSFRHFPNVAAFRFFYDEVWPLVRKQCPDAQFRVIAGPDGKRYCPLPADVLGHEFEADVRPFYASAQVVVVPTVVSAGTNLKVMEAMACARPVVSTSSGIGGLDLVPERDVLVADDPVGFADACLRLLRDEQARERLAAAGLAVVRERFHWDVLARQQAELWHELLNAERTRSRSSVQAERAERRAQS